MVIDQARQSFIFFCPQQTKKPISKDRINALKRWYKESTGFEPARRDEPGRRISSPLHYHSANSP